MNKYIYIVKMGENKTHKVNLKKFVIAVNQSLITESVFLTKERLKYE